jgi:MFS family permease
MRTSSCTGLRIHPFRYPSPKKPLITNVALPSSDASLHAPAAALELVVAGHGVAYASLLVLGDRYGLHRIFLGALIAFVLASAACGLVPSA